MSALEAGHPVRVSTGCPSASFLENTLQHLMSQRSGSFKFITQKQTRGWPRAVNWPQKWSECPWLWLWLRIFWPHLQRTPSPVLCCDKLSWIFIFAAFVVATVNWQTWCARVNGPTIQEPSNSCAVTLKSFLALAAAKEAPFRPRKLTIVALVYPPCCSCFPGMLSTFPKWIMPDFVRRNYAKLDLNWEVPPPKFRRTT